MSRRDSEDPLLRAFLDAYKLNLLTIPRENATVGDVYVNTKDGTSVPGALRYILTSEFVMPKVSPPEILTDISGKQTAALDVMVGLNLLEGFFSVLGAASAVGKVKAAYEQKRVGTIRFRFKEATRESVDAMEFGKALIPCRLNGRHPFVQPGNSYYVAIGVVRSKSITVSAKDQRSNSIALDVGALQNAVGTEGKIRIDRGEEGELTYEGTAPLAFGVELVQMAYDEAAEKFLLSAQQKAQRIRADEDIPRGFIGDPERGSAFIKIIGS